MLFIHSFNRYLLSIFYVLDAAPGPGNIAPAFMELTLLEGSKKKTLNKGIYPTSN